MGLVVAAGRALGWAQQQLLPPGTTPPEQALASHSAAQQSPLHPRHPPEPRHMQAHNLRLVPRSLWDVHVARSAAALSVQLHPSSRCHSPWKRCSHSSRLLLLAAPSFKTYSSRVPWQIRACARRCTSRSGTPRKRCCGTAQHYPNTAFSQLLPC